MKKLILTLTASVACLAAFGQGRVQFVNDSLHLVYYVGIGQPVWAGTSGPGGMPDGVTLVADFYLGTSSSSLSLITTTTLSGTAPGKFNIYDYQSPTIPGGSTVYIITQVREAITPPEATWTPTFDPYRYFLFYGRSQEFTFVLGTSTVAYPPMVAKTPLLGGGNSTWADGTYNMDFLSSGWRGAIAVGIPEPTSFALAGLGAATMLLCYRRK